MTRSLGEGGADRVASLQSVFLSDLGYDVYIVSILNYIKYPYKGCLLNLGKLKEQEDTILGRFKRFIAFKKFLNDNRIELVIDHRVRCRTLSETLISLLLYRMNVFYMVHNYKISLYFPSFKWMAKQVYRRAEYIVAVSKEVHRKISEVYHLPNVITILNPIDFDYINQMKMHHVEIDYKYIFWYGRFEDGSKNLTLLINAYNSSVLPDLEIKLILMGDGKDKLKMKRLITRLNLNESVVLLPFSKNPFAFVNNSFFVALSSRYEGLPMTILESLACGIPVVSVDYNTGNNEVIKNGYNGLLVRNNDVKALSEAFNTFVRDKELYLGCKENAIESVKPYGVEPISKQWEGIINA